MTELLITHRRQSDWIIYWAVAVHTVWGVALLLDPNVAKIVILVGLHEFVKAGVPEWVLGTGLILVSALALIGLLSSRIQSRNTSLCLLMPQYAVLMTSLFSDLWTVLAGLNSATGTAVSRPILLIVLWPVMAAAILHSIAIVERHLRWTR